MSNSNELPYQNSTSMHVQDGQMPRNEVKWSGKKGKERKRNETKRMEKNGKVRNGMAERVKMELMDAFAQHKTSPRWCGVCGRGVCGWGCLSAWCSGYHVCFTRRRSPVQSRSLIFLGWSDAS